MSKIKYFLESRKGKDLLTIIIIILVGVISFQLGRLSQNSSKELLSIDSEELGALSLKASENSLNQANNTESTDSLVFKDVNLDGRNYFGSTRGKKYYPFGCSAGKGIKEENIIYFNTKKEAEEKGYTLSGGCNNN